MPCIPVEVKGQFAGAGSLLPLCGSQKSNSGESSGLVASAHHLPSHLTSPGFSSEGYGFLFASSCGT